MKQFYILTLMLILLSALAFAGVDRVVSSTSVAAGSTFTIKYVVSGTSIPYYFIIRDTIASGGCTFVGTVDPKVLPQVLNNPATSSSDFIVKAPTSAGTCTLSGFSKLGTAANANFPDVVVTITGGGVTPTGCSWYESKDSKTGLCGINWIMIGIIGAVIVAVILMMNKKA